MQLYFKSSSDLNFIAFSLLCNGMIFYYSKLEIIRNNFMITLLKYDLFILSSLYLTTILHIQWNVKGCEYFEMIRHQRWC